MIYGQDGIPFSTSIGYYRQGDIRSSGSSGSYGSQWTEPSCKQWGCQKGNELADNIGNERDSAQFGSFILRYDDK